VGTNIHSPGGLVDLDGAEHYLGRWLVESLLIAFGPPVIAALAVVVEKASVWPFSSPYFGIVPWALLSGTAEPVNRSWIYHC
jgi:hypothetical protein